MMTLPRDLTSRRSCRKRGRTRARRQSAVWRCNRPFLSLVGTSNRDLDKRTHPGWPPDSVRMYVNNTWNGPADGHPPQPHVGSISTGPRLSTPSRTDPRRPAGRWHRSAAIRTDPRRPAGRSPAYNTPFLRPTFPDFPTCLARRVSPFPHISPKLPPNFGPILLHQYTRVIHNTVNTRIYDGATIYNKWPGGVDLEDLGLVC